MIDPVIINDADGKVGAAEVVMASMFFHDHNDNIVTYEAMVMATAAGMDVTLSESEDDPGEFTVTLAEKDFPTVDDPITSAQAALVALAYQNSMVEVVATDEGDLWTTQEFIVRRNRRPEILPATVDTTALVHPNALTAVEDTAAVGTTNEQATATLKSSQYFYDDTDDMLELSEASSDDDETATVQIMDDGTVTVTGVKAGTTNIRLKATDTGDLVSKQHTVTLTVDAGPVAKTETPLVAVTSSLSRQTNRVYTLPLAIDDYFTLNELAATEGHTYTVTSDDESVATVGFVTFPVAATGPAFATDDTDQANHETRTVGVTLKAIGTTTITITVTEDTADPVTAEEPLPVQSAKRTFTFEVID